MPITLSAADASDNVIFTQLLQDANDYVQKYASPAFEVIVSKELQHASIDVLYDYIKISDEPAELTALKVSLQNAIDTAYKTRKPESNKLLLHISYLQEVRDGKTYGAWYLGYRVRSSDSQASDEEKGFWASVVDGLKNIFTSISNIASSLANGTLWDNMWNSLLDKFFEWSSNILKSVVAFIISLADGTESLFKNPAAQILVGFSSKFGWLLWVVGTVMALLETAILYRQHQPIGDSFKDLSMNVFKSFFAVKLFTTLPLPLYLMISELSIRISSFVLAYSGAYGGSGAEWNGVLEIFGDTILGLVVIIIAIIYGFKVLGGVLKRGGILMVLILVGSLHMYNIPRGYWDGFMSWCRQIIGLCITHFCQIAIYSAGVALFVDSHSYAQTAAAMSLFLASAEVPRIADRFGFDSSVKGNAVGVVNTVATVIRLAAL